MKATEYRAWAHQNQVAHGSMSAVECETIAEAESYVTDFPTCQHGFATCGQIALARTDDAEVANRARELLIAAGYRWDGADGYWLKPQFCACARIHRSLKYARISVSAAEGPIAYRLGPGGYLPPGDRPTLG